MRNRNFIRGGMCLRPPQHPLYNWLGYNWERGRPRPRLLKGILHYIDGLFHCRGRGRPLSQLLFVGGEGAPSPSYYVRHSEYVRPIN